MSNPKTTFISKDNIDNFCNEKCSFNFNYSTITSLTATNNGKYLIYNYVDAGKPPVTFNNYAYSVDQIDIYFPSVHYFSENTGGNWTADGEIIIRHKADNIGNQLAVCIPISRSSITGSSAGSKFISSILKQVADANLTYSSSENPMNIDLNNNNYSLNNVVPSVPFFFYTGQDNNSTNINFIVYSLESAITIDSSIITELNKLVSPDQVYPSTDYLQYNETGKASNGETEIYIDCQPTGNSDEMIEVKYDKPPIKNDMFSGNNVIWIILIFALILILFILKRIYNKYNYQSMGAVFLIILIFIVIQIFFNNIIFIGIIGVFIIVLLFMIVERFFISIKND